ncbi:MAG TPA: FAD-dependent oxidoreductase, partial [Dehalococcoidales bacterium]|nr:FAD-dependent oxidoreductase [Dehalococcoidales bacterium]
NLSLSGKGIAGGLAVVLRNIFRRPVTSRYPEQREVLSRRFRGNELIWQEERCSGCTTCARTCPMGVIHLRTSGTGRLPAPCAETCPAHIDVPRYIKYIDRGQPAEALAVIREKIPFPSVCGRVCFHPCESQCQRRNIDKSVSIRVLKRWAAEHDDGRWKKLSGKAPDSGHKVAVVGAGPAGLTAAYYLAKAGHRVTVFEALPEAGGMMRVGIPDYRLPKTVLRAEIDQIKAAGVEIKTGVRITSLVELMQNGFKAVFLAIGAHQGMKMGVKGEDLPGVIDCATFLREAALDQPVKIGRRVAVVGGGNAAIDAARVALRKGAESVTMLYRRTEAEMPANPEEIKAAREENVKIEFLTNPTGINADNGRMAVTCQRMKLGEPDASGRRRPEPIKGSEFSVLYDTVIAAIGQRPEIPLDFKIVQEHGNIKADPATLATNLPGVFAGGDAQTGPSSVIEAIAAGRQGAISIDKYLGGKGEIGEVLAAPAEKTRPLSLSDKLRNRLHPAELPAAERMKDFSEVELSLNEKEAVTEASRCLECDMAYAVENISADMGYCIFCGLCVEACPRDALFMGYGFERARYRVAEFKLDKSGLAMGEGKIRSGYCRPNIETTLPPQTLLINRDRRTLKRTDEEA